MEKPRLDNDDLRLLKRKGNFRSSAKFLVLSARHKMSKPVYILPLTLLLISSK